MRSEGNELHNVRGLVASDENLLPDTFIAAAHELQSPLSLLRLLALELQNPGLSNTERSMITEHMQLTAEKSLRLTSDVTRYGQLQTTLFATQPVNVRELLRDVTSESETLYRASQKVLRVRHMARQPLVAANYDLLRRVMLTFVDNALHYSDSDGIIELFSTLMTDKQCVRVGVRDRGPALTLALWQSVRRAGVAPQPVHARPSSSGLSLRITCAFADAMGVKIGAIRHRDGASFYADVPVTKQLSLL